MRCLLHLENIDMVSTVTGICISASPQHSKCLPESALRRDDVGQLLNISSPGGASSWML